MRGEEKLTSISTFVEQNLKQFCGLNNRWHCHFQIFPWQKHLQFVMLPSRKTSQFL